MLSLASEVMYWTLLTIAIVSMFYAMYMLFFVYRPKNGRVFALFNQKVGLELVIVRRLYAFEFWLIFLIVIVMILWRL